MLEYLIEKKEITPETQHWITMTNMCSELKCLPSQLRNENLEDVARMKAVLSGISKKMKKSAEKSNRGVNSGRTNIGHKR